MYVYMCKQHKQTNKQHNKQTTQQTNKQHNKQTNNTTDKRGVTAECCSRELDN